MNLLKQALTLTIIAPSIVFANNIGEMTDQYAQKMLEASLQKQYQHYLKEQNSDVSLENTSQNMSNNHTDADIPSPSKANNTIDKSTNNLGVYHVKEGSLYQETKHLVEAVYGWHLVWLKQKIDYKIPYNYTIPIEGLSKTLSELLSGYPVKAKIYTQNHVVQIILASNSGY
ncbi:hypothetical protein [Fangia hongkongensis]|uniref:hypothetical protein n=1 Tax=Fangia hongkongensis TaxID=270495 RepID=UPI0003624E4A|nr:hypothetical protein [Fangia hongkongensis]MBK2124010.1 hypothetical protein [Fangia hongkongensis]